ncbi:hypothetical protein BCR35DRAFT_300675, partial [Leucosporidium creatinivorum]
MSLPASKKAKMDIDSNSTGGGRTTRSQSAASSSAAAQQASNSNASAPTTNKRPASPIYIDDDDDDDEEPFEYDSDVNSVEIVQSDHGMDVDEDEQQQPGDDDDGCIVLSSDHDDDDEQPQTPPEPIRPALKGKLTSRKQFQADVAHLGERFSASDKELVTGFKKEGDEQVCFTLPHDAFKKGLRLVVMFPDLAGYPNSHQCICYSENEDIPPDVEDIMGEVASLPEQADRSLNGIIQFLIKRLVLKEASPYPSAQPSQAQSSDEEGDYYPEDDVLFGLMATPSQSPAMTAALRADFKELIEAGYRPGYTRVSELDNVVSVSKKVNSLGVPLNALQAWDSDLITGEVVYLVLLMNFGSKYPVNPDSGTRGEVQFKIGISPKYKPSKTAIAAAFRAHSANTYTKGEFQAISLSAPLDSLFSDAFQKVLLTRRSNSGCGWAGAEHHCLQPDSSKGGFDKKACRDADKEEKAISGSYLLPKDPMSKSSKPTCNYPLLAFSYLLRRFVMCPRFCLICFKTVDQTITALKPFVCDSQLCLFQLISLGLGPSLEHEIKTNAPAVDLLIQLAFTSAKENALKGEHQPQGLSLEVPVNPLTYKKGDATVEFDGLDQAARNAGVVALITELPPVPEMRTWLTGEDLSDNDRLLNRNRKLTDMRDGGISNSAWKLLRWIVASNTSYLKQIEDEDELVQGVPKAYRQFRLVVGSPAKEHLLKEAIKAAQAKNSNARIYPTLYAWHGSAVKNWHSILREGLHFKETINGRAYGHGVYTAKDGAVSMGHYSQPSQGTWKNADFGIGKMAALVELVNLPNEFVSSNPYLVVDKLDWIQCRYLLIQRTTTYSSTAETTTSSDEAVGTGRGHLTRPIPLDPMHPPVLNGQKINIPDVTPKLEAMDRKLAGTFEELNMSDAELMRDPPPESKNKRALGSTSSAGRLSSSSQSRSQLQGGSSKPKQPDLFVPADATRLKLIRLLPPPAQPNRGASMTIQREMRTMIKVQDEKGPTEAGFYFDPERSNDNIFTWVVELIGFDPDLPLSKDMKAKGVTSLLFEIRFGDSYPLSPPFFRLVHPRFLPFIHGGGGHVTGGGSICMDLLTPNGWNPVYQIEAVLLQIRMA